MNEPTVEYEFCEDCCGSGKDEHGTEWDGRCLRCNGTGEIRVFYHDDEDDWDLCDACGALIDGGETRCNECVSDHLGGGRQ